jgi:nucleolar protein 58
MEFDTFEDKSSAINADTGVNKRLADMIYKWRLPGMKLAVGKPEYKTIIESKLVSILLLVWLYFFEQL